MSGHTLIAQCIRSTVTERVYIVLSSYFLEDLTEMFAAHGHVFRLEEIPYPHSEPATFERHEQAWRQLTHLVGLDYAEAMVITPVLERAIALLEAKGV